MANTSWGFCILGPICYGFSTGSGGYTAHPDFSSPGLPFRHTKVDLQCRVPYLTVGTSSHPNHGWSAQYIDLIHAEPMKFSLPGTCIGNEGAMDCNHGATCPHVPEGRGTAAAAWILDLLSQRFAKLEINKNYGEVYI